MKTSLKVRIKDIIEKTNLRGFPKWKPESDITHLEKRKRRKDIPLDWELKDYNKLILNIMNGKENDIHLYHLKTFEQEYFVFNDGYWIIIIGEDSVIETAFLSKNIINYLSLNKGYKYLGKVKEVLE